MKETFIESLSLLPVSRDFLESLPVLSIIGYTALYSHPQCWGLKKNRNIERKEQWEKEQWNIAHPKEDVLVFDLDSVAIYI